MLPNNEMIPKPTAKRSVCRGISFTFDGSTSPNANKIYMLPKPSQKVAGTVAVAQALARSG